MNLVELKTAKEVTLDGVAVSFVTQDKALKEICLTSGGKRFIVKPGDTYSSAIRVFRADEHTFEKKHVLEGEVLGLKVSEHFDSFYDAERRKSQLEISSDAKLSIEERDVKIDGSGQVVKTVDFAEVPF